MNTIRQPARRLAQPLLRRPPRRHAAITGKQDDPGAIAGRQDSSTGHADSAGQAHPTSHPPHPEPVNESLGVRPPLSAPCSTSHSLTLTKPPTARFLHHHRPHPPLLRPLQIQPDLLSAPGLRPQHQHLLHIPGTMVNATDPSF